MEFLFFSFLLCSAPSSFEDGNRRERKPHFSTRRQNRRKPSFGRQQHITRISFLLSLRRKRAFIFLPLSSPPLRCASFPEKEKRKTTLFIAAPRDPSFLPHTGFFFVCFPLRTPIFHLEGGRRILLVPSFCSSSVFPLLLQQPKSGVGRRRRRRAHIERGNMKVFVCLYRGGERAFPAAGAGAGALGPAMTNSVGRAGRPLENVFLVSAVFSCSSACTRILCFCPLIFLDY